MIKNFIAPFLIFIVLASTNFFVDPANLFNNNYEVRIAEIINAGKIAGNTANYDERIFQKIFLQKNQKNIDTIILGSSRSLEIGREIIKTVNYFNSSVSGASLQDLIAIFNIHEIEKNEIKNILINIDPWIFNKLNGQTRWKSIQEYYLKDQNENLTFKNKLKLILKNNKKFLQLISPSYFQESIKYLIQDPSLSKKKLIPIENAEISPLASLDQNGTHTPTLEVRNRTLNHVEIEAKKACIKPYYSYSNYNQIDNELMQELVTFIKNLKSKNIQVTIFLAPYSPIVFDCIEKDKDVVSLSIIENKIMKIATEENLPVIGSYNPSKLGLSLLDFYDGLHLRKSSLPKIFEASCLIKRPINSFCK